MRSSSGGMPNASERWIVRGVPRPSQLVWLRNGAWGRRRLLICAPFTRRCRSFATAGSRVGARGALGRACNSVGSATGRRRLLRGSPGGKLRTLELRRGQPGRQCRRPAAPKEAQRNEGARDKALPRARTRGAHSGTLKGFGSDRGLPASSSGSGSGSGSRSPPAPAGGPAGGCSSSGTGAPSVPAARAPRAWGDASGRS